MSDDPMDEIEQQRAMTGMGMAGFHIYEGAREAGASRMEALRVVAAWFLGLALNTEN